jgi:acid stress-induced BolA-like protein IbaG/YrbA
LIATVVSASFRQQDEALRQESVWKYLSDKLGSSEINNVEFIFTSTPEENSAVSPPSSVA